MFRRHVLFIRVLNKTLPRTFHASAYSEAVSPKLLSLRVTSPPLPVRLLSCVTQRKVDYLLSMQPVPEKSSASGQQEPRTEQSGTAVRKEPTAGSKKEKKVKKVKSPKKARGRKQKEKESECRDNLLAELPFANTKIWEELGFAGGASDTKKKRKRTEKGRVEGEEDGEKEKKKKKGCPRPNYFVSIPITNQKIKQAVEEVQAEVLQKDPRLSRALIPVGTLHITLLVTHLATQEEVDTYIKHAVEEAQAEVLQKDPRLSRALIPVGTLQITLLVTHLATQEEVDTAAAALEEMQPTLSALLGGRSLVLPFRGIGHFRQEVAFIQISEGEHLSTLSSIADSVRRAFEEKGISPGDHKDFKPHLTFIKLSRAPKLRRQGIKKLDAALYAAFEQTEFGEESACTLDLCSMLKKKSADGYYHREKTVTFDLLQTTQRTSRKRAKGGPELDDEELMSLSKRLVEDAVFRAVQQYMEETQQNGAAPKDGAPPPLTTNK